MKVILLSYLNRSGSTFLVNQLSKFTEIAVCPEADELYNWLLTRPDSLVDKKWHKRLLGALSSDEKFQTWKLPIKSLNFKEETRFELFLEIVKLFRDTHYKKAEFIIFKHNYLNKLINTASDRQDLIWLNLIRNPYAVYASQKETVSPASGKPMSNNPLAFTDAWNSFYLSTLREKGDHSPLLIVYENLVTNLNKEIISLSKAIGLKSDWAEVKGNKGHVTGWLNSKYKAIHASIDQKANEVHFEKWKGNLSAVELAILSRHNGSKFYQHEKFSVSRLALRIYMLYYRLDRKTTYIRSILRTKLRNNA